MVQQADAGEELLTTSNTKGASRISFRVGDDNAVIMCCTAVLDIYKPVMLTVYTLTLLLPARAGTSPAEQIARAKALITSPSIPRSRRPPRIRFVSLSRKPASLGAPSGRGVS